jgi:hypothetical protein
MSDVLLSETGRPPAPRVAEQTLRGVGMAEQVEGLLRPPLDELVRLIPRLRPWRGFLDGAWVVGARTDADDLRRIYARVDFELRPDPESERVEAVCRSTILSRDLPVTRLAVTLDQAGRSRLAAWFENTLLEFARRHFEAIASGR